MAVVFLENGDLIAGWDTTSATVQEGGPQRRLYVELEGGAVAVPVTVPVLVGGTALSSTYGLEWPGGVPGQVTIPANEPSAYVGVTATAGAGETIELTLEATAGVVISGDATAVVQITEAASGATTVEVDPIESIGAGALVQAVVPIDPTPAGSLPAFYLDDAAADVFPIAYTHDGLVDSVQVVGPTAGGAEVQLTRTGSVPAPGSAAWFADSVALTLTADVAGLAARMTCDLHRTVVETMRDGMHMRERVYFTRLENPSPAGTTDRWGPGVHWFETRRADCDVIEGYLLVSNDCYDHEGDPFSEHDEVTGHWHFRELRLAVPSGWVLISEFDEPSMQSSAGYVVRPQASAYQVLPGRSRFLRHYCIAKIADIAKAREIVELRGCGVARTGPDSAFMRRFWGASRDFLPQFTQDFRLGPNPVSGPFGQAAVDRLLDDHLASVRGAAEAGVANGSGKFELAAQGWFHPLGYADAGAPGGVGIHCRDGYHLDRRAWRASRIKLEHVLQRHATGITHPDTGAQINEKDMADANPAGAGKMPWMLYYNSTRNDLWHPHFLGSGDYALGGYPVTRYRPEGRPWNAAPGTVVQGQTVYPFVGVSNYCNLEFDHHARFYSHTQALAWGLNLGVAKWLARGEGAHCAMSTSRREVAGVLHTENLYTYDQVWLHRNRALLLAANRVAWGGYQIPNGARLEWSRGLGHASNTVAEAHRLLPPGHALRTELAAWASAVSLTADYMLGPRGGAGRRGQDLGPWQHPSDPNLYGETDLQGSTGAIPATWSSDLWFSQSFLAFGFSALELAIQPRPSGAPSGQSAPHLRHAVQCVRARWEGADELGRLVPHGFNILAVGSDHNESPPRVEGPMPWWFEVVPNPPFQPGEIEEDVRSATAILGAYRITGEAYYLECIKRLVDRQPQKWFGGNNDPNWQRPPSVTLEDLEANMQFIMGTDGDLWTQEWTNFYAGVLGEVQALIREAAA